MIDRMELAGRRNSAGEITKILLCDLWGLDHNSIRMVIRGHGDVNLFCLVSVLGGEIVKQPCTGEELRVYLDGDNKFKQKFKYFGRAKDFFSGLIDQEVREQMANLIVFKEPGMKETP
jgi:hypothetical protein